MVEKLRKLRTYQRELGAAAGTKWALLRTLNNKGLIRRKSVSVHPRFLAHAVGVRMQQSSDPAVFDQHFVRRELGFAERLSHLNVIVDLGANVGYASAFLLNLFSEAFVLAVEPDPENARCCRGNLGSYGHRVRIVEGAAWSSCGGVVLSRATFGDGLEWATEVRDARRGETPDVAAFDMPSLLDQCPGSFVDLLKIDIEGSEKALFSGRAQPWLDRVRNIAIELHDDECRRAFLSTLQNYQFEQMQCGDYLVCLGIKRKSPSASSS